MLKSFRVILMVSWMLLPSVTLASACQDIPNRIYYDIRKYANALQQQRLPWMKLSWLESQLGQPQVTRSVTNQTDYSWSCEDSTGPVLTLTLNATNRIVAVSGQYNLNSGSGLFGYPVDTPAKPLTTPIETEAWHLVPAKSSSIKIIIPTSSNVKVSPQAASSNPTVSAPTSNKLNQEMEMHQEIQNAVLREVKKAANKAISTGVKAYNEYFKTQFSTGEQIQQDMRTRVVNYCTALRQCVPGTYELAYPFMSEIIYSTNHIQGQQNGRCLVQSTNVILGKSSTSKCEFSANTLTLFTNQMAISVAEGGIPDNAMQLLPQLEQAMKECQEVKS